MVDAMRAALDELMGKERNLAPEERTGKGITYKDPQICKYALGGLCPYGLFKNTKSDLGLCKYEVHDDDVEFGPAKEEYDKLPEAEKDRYGYRNEMVELLRTLCRDMDRKIERQKERAAKESASRAPTATEQAELDKLKQQEKDALKKSEEAAEQGNVDESMAFANQAEQLQKQYTELHKLATTPDRTMQVCEVCGVFINSSDSDQRKADHLAGKQYTGWVKIRETLKACLAEDEEKRKNGVLPRNDHERERRGRDERGREDRDRDRERDRDRDRERDRRRRSRSRDYDRHRRDSYRDRDRDRSSRHYSARDRRGGGGNYNRGTEIPPPSDLYSKRPTGERERYY